MREWKRLSCNAMDDAEIQAAISIQLPQLPQLPQLARLPA